MFMAIITGEAESQQMQGFTFDWQQGRGWQLKESKRGAEIKPWTRGIFRLAWEH